MEKHVIKASGERELFHEEKFKRSLRKAGAAPEVIEQLVEYVLTHTELQTTKDIYAYAYNTLKRSSPALASRYHLKYALTALGPSGYPFEQFVARLFEEQGYRTQTNAHIQGTCIVHEADILLERQGKRTLVECKFHQPRLACEVKVTLYTKARLDDVKDTVHAALLVTNTKFTAQARAYGTCVGLQLLSWAYPEKENLAHLIDRYAMQPITSLTSLSRKQQRFLIEKGVVLCKDVAQASGVLRQLHENEKKLGRIIEEAQTICALGAIE